MPTLNPTQAASSSPDAKVPPEYAASPAAPRVSGATSVSLLERLRADPGDQAAWRDLDAFYRPFLRHWAIRLGVRHADIDDVVQSVVIKILRLLPTFTYRGPGAFRA